MKAVSYLNETVFYKFYFTVQENRLADFKIIIVNKFTSGLFYFVIQAKK